jgi:hypothetical protein
VGPLRSPKLFIIQVVVVQRGCGERLTDCGVTPRIVLFFSFFLISRHGEKFSSWPFAPKIAYNYLKREQN